MDAQGLRSDILRVGRLGATFSKRGVHLADKLCEAGMIFLRRRFENVVVASKGFPILLAVFQ